MTAIPNFDTWVQRRKPNPYARLRLFGFPYAGGGVAIFRAWAERLPGDIEVCAVQLPGRDGRMREGLFTDLPALVEATADGLRPWLNRPYAFFGHSMGALIAFEVARRLRQLGEPLPVHLLVSARRAPQIPNPDPLLHRLPEPDFVDQLRWRYNGIPQAILTEPELMQLFLPILRADFTVVETYRYLHQAPLDCPITAFGGLQDDRVSHADLEAWQELTRDTCRVHMLSGDHFFLQSAQAQLLQLVAQHLAG